MEVIKIIALLLWCVLACAGLTVILALLIKLLKDEI